MPNQSSGLKFPSKKANSMVAKQLFQKPGILDIDFHSGQKNTIPYSILPASPLPLPIFLVCPSKAPCAASLSMIKAEIPEYRQKNYANYINLVYTEKQNQWPVTMETHFIFRLQMGRAVNVMLSRNIVVPDSLHSNRSILWWNSYYC